MAAKRRSIDFFRILLGFGGIAFAAAGIAKILFFIFLVVFVVMLLTGLMGRRSPPI